MKKVLEIGKESRHEYDNGRITNFTFRECETIAELLANHNQTVEKEDGLEKASELFERLVEKGIFHRIEDGKYVVPILSIKKVGDSLNLEKKKYHKSEWFKNQLEIKN
ncbi:MAG: hypothetical protein OXC67_09575 [Flavobacteriaceae bacterium]|nr:hypothetical protein [Flavobacteriaceae bacterium]